MSETGKGTKGRSVFTKRKTKKDKLDKPVEPDDGEEINVEITNEVPEEEDEKPKGRKSRGKKNEVGPSETKKRNFNGEFDELMKSHAELLNKVKDYVNQLEEKHNHLEKLLKSPS